MAFRGGAGRATSRPTAGADDVGLFAHRRHGARQCRPRAGEAHIENVEVHARHVGIGMNPLAVRDRRSLAAATGALAAH